MMAVRGYTLDNRFNYEREGLPINAETSIPLENKERIEILKGLSGLQAGVSAPGGLVNYVVKRPTDADLRVTRLELAERGDVLASVDAGGRVPSAAQFGYRLNLASEDLEPKLRDASGSRAMASFAGDWKLSEDSLVEAEVEWSKRSQPSQAGFSLLGSSLPAVPDPDLNLNNQPWSQPVVFQGLTGTLRVQQKMNSQWRWAVIGGFQNLKTDDRLAYPFGCSAENNYDRFCSDGTYDMYDYRSENERRGTQALKATLEGDIPMGFAEHKVVLGALTHSERQRLGPQAYNYVGSGNIQGTAVLPANPAALDTNTDRDARNNDFFVSDHISWFAWNAWLGARVSRIHRESIKTDGTQATAYDQSFTIPWGALSYNLDRWLVYVSTGQGEESFVTPNKNTYTQAGEYLQAVTSRQWEVGAKGFADINWSFAFFQIQHPVVTDLAPNYQVDGEDNHKGLEGELAWQSGRWNWDLSGMLLTARREKSTLTPDVNGKRPVNVPDHTWRLGVAYQLPGFADMQFSTRLVQEGRREVTADNSISIPTWTRWDAALSYSQQWTRTKLLWRFSVENLEDARYWRESPTQYGHIYLYPGEARTFTLSVQASL
jgi:iron complex outermembrane receptor protein